MASNTRERRYANSLPWPALLALACTGLIIIMTETLPAGLLPQLARGMGVSQSAAGQLLSVYALGTVLAAIPALSLTRSLNRKPLLLAGVTGFLVGNAATALLPDYSLVLVARFLTGALSGLLWGLIPGYARRIVPPAMVGRGLAVAMVGTPIALSVGTPLGTFTGSQVGWRWAFALMSVVAVILLFWILVAMPNVPGQPASTQTPLRQVLLFPGVLPVLTVVLCWMLAHNILYTYIAPYLNATGIGGSVGLVLLIFGISSLVGIWLTGLLIDRALRGVVLGSLTGFGLVALSLALAEGVPIVFYLATVAWGLTFGGASTQLNTAAADAAGEEADVVAAAVTTSWNSAILGGSAVGGLLLNSVGPSSFAWVLVGLISLALLVAKLARHRAFRPQHSRRHVGAAPASRTS